MSDLHGAWVFCLGFGIIAGVLALFGSYGARIRKPGQTLRQAQMTWRTTDLLAKTNTWFLQAMHPYLRWASPVLLLAAAVCAVLNTFVRT